MSSRFLGLKVLSGAIALAVAGNAMANTAIQDASTGGTVFLNVVSSNGQSFLFDTSKTEATLAAGYSANLGASGINDPNYSAFVAATAGTTLSYSVFALTYNPGVTANLQFTSNSAIVAQVGGNIGQAAASIDSGFIPYANQIVSTTTNSLLAAAGSTNFGNWQNTEPTVDGNLMTSGSSYASIGTALNYWTETSSNLSSASKLATLTESTAQWNLNSSGVLTYGAAAVPLPAPLLLLISGLGLMGVVARRNKSVA